jgi:uncharacterized repeat protein (TIGR02543 family)
MRRTLTGAAAFLLLLFVSCAMAGPESDPVPGLDGKAAVRVSIEAEDAQGRTAWPSNAGLADVADWELYAGLAGGDPESRVEQPVSAGGSTVYFEPGTYNFTLKGYKAGGALILEGIISNREITLAGPNALAFTVAPVLTGSGTVSITIDLPAGHNITAAKVYKDGAEITPSPAAEVNGDKVTFAQSCAAGTYFFSVRLFAANGDLYGVMPELAQVRANLTSAISQTLTLADLNRKYSITYHLNGGAFDAGVDNPGYYRSADAAFTLPEPNRAGYIFRGWYGSEDVSTGSVVTEIAQGSMEDKGYWAKWTPITYTVNYHSNNYSYDSTPAIFTYDGTHTFAAATTFSRTGYAFAGWNTQDDGGGTDYAAGAAAPNLAAVQDTVVDMYAQWTPVVYTITYSLNNGTNAAQNPETYTIETLSITLADPSRAGYDFQGWYTEAEFTNPATEILWGSMGNKTFYARWIGIGKDITAFSFTSPSATGLIDGDAKTVTVSFPAYTDMDITGMVPTISVSPGATVSPPSGQAQDFSGPVQYTVRAEDGSSAVYTVTVTAPGQGAVTMVFPTDTASEALTADPIILSKTPTPATHTLTVSGDFDSYRWRVNGAFKGTGKSITLDAADYPAAVYQITVEVTLDGVVYSKTGAFTVQN